MPGEFIPGSDDEPTRPMAESSVILGTDFVGFPSQ
jgi:hypothetical protein